MIFDYEIFKLIWWLLIGVLLIGFVVIDGMDMGVVILFCLVGKIDVECWIVINIIGVYWDGN